VTGFSIPKYHQMTYSFTSTGPKKWQYENSKTITILWGSNVIASVVSTILAAICSMVIGFNGKLLIAGLYLAALCSAVIAVKRRKQLEDTEEKISQARRT
jgi:hypothetical protein